MKTENLLISPMSLNQALPCAAKITTFIEMARQSTRQILTHQDPRLIVLIGPCSIHDPLSAIEYAQKLSQLAQKHQTNLHIIMRCYIAKPRTCYDWKGFLYDPMLDGSHQIEQGLYKARKLLLTINEIGMPCASEFLNMLTVPYLSDLITWSVIGARTSHSQYHRELASQLDMPVGFKNDVYGNIEVAIQAIKTAAQPHTSLSINAQGQVCVLHANGNHSGHLVLRGGDDSTNYCAAAIQHAAELCEKHKCLPSIIVDCSHGNSQKQYQQQLPVLQNIAQQISAGNQHVKGIMLESHLMASHQILDDPSKLTYGQSITDACIGWPETVAAIELLSEAVARRTHLLIEQ